jgi:hypothetical protein
MKNDYSKVIPQEVLDKVNAKLLECYTELKPFCVELTPDQRDDLPKLGIRNTGKVSSIANEMRVAPEYTPPMFIMDEVNKDSKVISDLSPVATKITNIEMMVNDTLTLAGSEVFLAYMDYYSSVKHSASRNDPKAMAIYERLKPLFTPQAKAAKKEDDKPKK